MCKQILTSSFIVSWCLILNYNFFFRRLSSSVLSNPSWQSSPSSCRPLANITMEILSEHHLSLHFLLHVSYASSWLPEGLFAVYVHGNNLQIEIIISPLHSWHDENSWIKSIYFKLKLMDRNFTCALLRLSQLCHMCSHTHSFIGIVDNVKLLLFATFPEM